jgi:hypothetical protein
MSSHQSDDGVRGGLLSHGIKRECRPLGNSCVRFYRLECLTEPLQEIFSRHGAKGAKKKYFPVSPNLARFASLRETFFPISFSAKI